MNTDVDEEVIMVLKGDLAEMMIQVAPEVYRKYVAVDKKGTKILYVKLQKALYGLMRGDEEEARPLEEDQALAFHHTVAQLLFMATRARRDIQTAVAFLTTRVKNPDEDDWGKLKRVLKYLNGTKYLKLKLSVDNLGMLKWYVDGSHNVHWDCKGHGGAVFRMGKGATTIYSRKVKLNSRSSTETELYAADMFMPEMLWSLRFIQAQGYETEWVGLYQEITSARSCLLRTGGCRAVRRQNISRQSSSS